MAGSTEAEMGINGCWLSTATLVPLVRELQQLLLEHPMGGAAKSPCVGWGLWEQQRPSGKSSIPGGWRRRAGLLL